MLPRQLDKKIYITVTLTNVMTIFIDVSIY